MKVLKFGGTSVGSAQRMRAAVGLVNSSESKIVVLSAMSGTTNSLVEIANALYEKKNNPAKELINSLEKKYYQVVDELYDTAKYLQNGKELIKYHFDYLRTFTMDLFTLHEERAVLAQGELITTALFQFLLEEKKTESILLSALNFMRTDEYAEPDLKYIEENLKNEFKKYANKNLFITQGFICRNDFGEIDNLKRGGSDYSASLIGAAINAEEIQIWTDIDGMHNNDPRIVSNTKPIAELSFDEAAELAYFGAKILHPSSVLPAMQNNIPVRLLNTLQPKAKGTIITQNRVGDNIKAVAAKEGITVIKIKSGRMLLAHGFLRKVFEIFERHKTSIDMITTSEVAVSLTIDSKSHLPDIVKELKEFSTVEVDYDETIICIVGDFLAEKQGYGLKIFEALKKIPIRMISYGGSKNNISLLVKTEHKNNALIALHQGLFQY